jgi:hypothetical protein
VRRQCLFGRMSHLSRVPSGNSWSVRCLHRVPAATVGNPDTKTWLQPSQPQQNAKVDDMPGEWREAILNSSCWKVLQSQRCPGFQGEQEGLQATREHKQAHSVLAPARKPMT